MSGDLEDFLRRAAARRQTKSPTQPQRASQPKPRGQADQQGTRRREYTDRRQERVPQTADVADEPITAEVVSDEIESLSDQRRRIKAATEQAEKIRQQTEEKLPQQARPSRSEAPTGTGSTSNAAEDLLGMLRHPSGLRTAFLLREVLDRPEHRW